MQATIIIIKNCKILGCHNIFDSIYYEHVAQRQLKELTNIFFLISNMNADHR